MRGLSLSLSKILLTDNADMTDIVQIDGRY